MCYRQLLNIMTLFFIERYPVYVLESLGLVNNAHFPNLPAVKELLNLRFNIASDNTDEGNPLIEIRRN